MSKFKTMKDEIKILDAAVVTEDLPEHGLKCGAVVERCKDGAFEVEFSNESGETYAFAALQAEKLMPLYLSSSSSRLEQI